MTTSRSTLIGIATGTPDGGVAIVRISGPRAAEIGSALAGSLPAARRLARRTLVLGPSAEDREDALIVLMPGPGSFTGEDVVELHVHAGARNLRRVMEAALRHGGVAAGAGDFSRRAFELGTITLDQAEGIAALIAAQTDEALAQARRLAAGEVGREVDALVEAVAGLRTELEANLDFVEDVEEGDQARWQGEARTLRGRVEGWLAGFERARRGRERARVVLAGPPNAGKSSLFNALLGRRRALVADQPGTTRDYVEAELELGRHVAVLVDTAGLRESAEAVEASGIEMSRDQVEGADVVLWVEPGDASSVTRPGWLKVDLEVETKRDLGTRRPGWLGVTLGGPDAGAGVEPVREALTRWFEDEGQPIWVGLARHRDRAAEAVVALGRAETLLRRGEPLEVVAYELGIAHARLEEITGRTRLGPVGEEVLDRIFSTFCIGK